MNGPFKPCQTSIGVLETYSNESPEEQPKLKIRPIDRLLEEMGGPLKLDGVGEINYITYRKWRSIGPKCEAIEGDEAVQEAALELLIHTARGKAPSSPASSPRLPRRSACAPLKLEIKRFSIQDGYLALLLVPSTNRVLELLSPRLRRQKGSPRLGKVTQFFREHGPALSNLLKKRELNAELQGALTDFLKDAIS